MHHITMAPPPTGASLQRYTASITPLIAAFVPYIIRRNDDVSKNRTATIYIT